MQVPSAAAARALRHFKIDPNEVDATPKVSTSFRSKRKALALVNSTKGVAAHGEAAFLPKRPVIPAYTVSEDEPQKVVPTLATLPRFTQ